MMGVVKRIMLPDIAESGQSRVVWAWGRKIGTERRKKHQGWASEGRLDGQEGSIAESRNWLEGIGGRKKGATERAHQPRTS